MSRSISIDDIHAHYERNWGTNYAVGRWTAGPSWQMGPAFHVLEFPPGAGENMWTYATVGMSVVPEEGYGHGLELHLHSPTAEESHVELLAVVAHYHLTGEKLGLHHTVAFGRPWYPRSTCSYGLISLPYLFGPRLEWLGDPRSSGATRFLWLVPITGAERSFKIEQGDAEQLEDLFERTSFNYLDPRRPSVI